MPNLFLHKRPVKSIFNLLGEAENDITFSLGWALSRSPGLLRNFLKKVTHARQGYNQDRLVVALQELQKDSGITDVELRDESLHLIVEAKRGWSPPSVQVNMQ